MCVSFCIDYLFPGPAPIHSWPANPLHLHSPWPHKMDPVLSTLWLAGVDRRDQPAWSVCIWSKTTPQGPPCRKQAPGDVWCSTGDHLEGGVVIWLWLLIKGWWSLFHNIWCKRWCTLHHVISGASPWKAEWIWFEWHPLKDNEAIQWACGTARVVLYPACVPLQKVFAFHLRLQINIYWWCTCVFVML